MHSKKFPMKFLCLLNIIFARFYCNCSRDFGVVIGMEKDDSYKVCYTVDFLMPLLWLLTFYSTF